MEPGNINRLLLIEKVLLLKSLNLFKDTPENILADLAPLMKEMQYEQGIEIFKEGETGDCMYIIQQGNIRIHKGNTTLAILKEKEVFGELSLLDADTRSASATAATDCILYKIDQEPFYELMDERPEIAKGFIKILCQRLRTMNEKSRQQ
ncbi:MAG TPA: cyclic nucleotide-binding domain-containing protein [Chitinophagaceae bacterium]|jgi:CRP-like cAMP-binding protein|nr:cyclic nucleotide-binding domain-containing protein [Chitinophagaceae bacterium]